MLSSFCNLLQISSNENHAVSCPYNVTGDCTNLLSGSAKAHDDDPSHWMALHSSRWVHFDQRPWLPGYLPAYLSLSEALRAPDMASMSLYSAHSVILCHAEQNHKEHAM